MDIASIATRSINLQKQCINNFFDTLTIFQNYTRKTNDFWTNEMRLNGEVQGIVDQWRAIWQKNSVDCRKLIDDVF